MNGTIGRANPKYFVFAQYTRHIRPGMMILSTPDADIVAAYDPREGKLTLVTLNAGPARPAAYDLSDFPSVRGPVTRWLTEPKGRARGEVARDGYELRSGVLRTELPADSVQTFEVEGVALPP